MSNILPFVTVFLSLFSWYLLVRDFDVCKEYKDSKAVCMGLPKDALIYSIVMLLITVGGSTLYVWVYRDITWIDAYKRMILLAVIWPVAYIDIKTYRIPNAYILFGVACRVIMIPIEFLVNGKAVWTTLLSEGVAAIAIFLAAVLCSLCVKNALGYGDIKLFMVMGLLLGLDAIWGAVFLALIISFVIAIVVLVTKKKTRKDVIPFGPAIVAGTYLAILVLGM